ncbi:MAG TPA: M56 family metallopeptidase [Thermoanaerobaculia bacterium]|nr:M56 family metallopeptidase [Thermoanaerobaculia bacterium]
MPLIQVATRLQSMGVMLPALLVLLKATLILVIARLFIAALPRLSAAAKHLWLTIAICSVIALPVVEFAVPAWRVAVFHKAPQKQLASTKLIGATGDEEDSTPSTVATAITVAKAAGVVPEAKLNAVSRGIDRVKQSWQGFILLGLFAVALGFILRIAAGVFGVRKVAAAAERITSEESLRELDLACDRLRLPRAVRLLRSDRVSVPVVWGLSKPILVLPASSIDWPAERLRVVLLHELAHVKRGDAITLLVTRVAVALFWFHPLMWSLERFSRAECERACDDLVLDSGTKPSDYAEHLLSIAKALPQADPFRSVTLAMSRRSQLEGRLLSILQPHVRRAHFKTATVAIVSALALIVLVPFAALRLVAAPQQASSTIDVYADKETKHSTFDLQKLVDTADVLVARYERMTSKRQPETGQQWYSEGYDLYRHEKFDDAIAAFKQAAAHGYRVDDALYNIACSYALMDDAPNAVNWLRQSVNAGYDDYNHIANDSDFDAIRTDASFRKLIAAGADQTKGNEDRVTATLNRYETLRGLPAADGQEWFSVGFDLLPLRQYDRSIDAFQHAVGKGYKPATSLYNIACGYSRKGDTSAALNYLNKALNEGFDSPDKLADDHDLDNVRKDPRFASFQKMANDLRLQSGNFLDMVVNGNDWPGSLAHFRAMTQNYPNIGRSWFNLGYCALQAGQNAESTQAFQHALGLGYRVPTTTYNIACAYARSGQKNAAITWLQKARVAGFELSKYIDSDTDLISLRSDPRFRDLRSAVRER